MGRSVTPLRRKVIVGFVAVAALGGGGALLAGASSASADTNCGPVSAQAAVVVFDLRTRPDIVPPAWQSTGTCYQNGIYYRYINPTTGETVLAEGDDPAIAFINSSEELKRFSPPKTDRKGEGGNEPLEPLEPGEPLDPPQLPEW